MSKTMSKAVLVIILLSLALSAVALVLTLLPSAKDVQYVMYLGTNDKDTGELAFESREAAKEKAEDILIANFGGYTIQEAEGGWIDDGGQKCQEYTLVIYLSDTTADKVHAAADELLKVFNQSSILIQANETTTEFYSGAAQ